MRKSLIVLLYAAVFVAALALKADAIAAVNLGADAPILRSLNMKLYGSVCVPPQSGDWTITAGTTCTCNAEAWRVPANVHVYGTLDMQYNCTLVFDNTTSKIYVYSGGIVYVGTGSSFNTGWMNDRKFRIAHNITGTTKGMQTDYWMNITVNYLSGTNNGADVYLNRACMGNFSDIRFTNATGAPLDYWMFENATNSYARFLVKIGSIPASPGNATIYIYYDNATLNATTQSNNTLDSIGNDYTPNVPMSPTYTLDGGTALTCLSYDTKSVLWRANIVSASCAGIRFKSTDSFHTVNSSSPNTQTLNVGWNYVPDEVICPKNGWPAIYTGGSPTCSVFYGTTNTLYYGSGDVAVGGTLGSVTSTYVMTTMIWLRPYVNPEPTHAAWGVEETKP